MDEFKYDVFISYSRKDYIDEQKNIVIPGNEISKILQALTDAGISYWIDTEGIERGNDFPEVISSSIASSSILLFISSKNSIKSKWVTKEVAFADNRNKYIIPVRLDNTPYNNRLALRIADLDYIDYFKNPEEAIITLIKSINKFKDKLKDKIEQLQRIAIIENSCNVHIEKEASLEADKQKLLHEIDSIQDKNKQVELQKKICSTNPSENSSFLQKVKEVEKENASLKSTCEHLSSKINNKVIENDKLNKDIIKKNKRIYQLLSFLAILTILFALGLFYILSKPSKPKTIETKPEKPMLVFAGGGSVYNYILNHPVDSKKIDLRNYDTAIYINQPSGDAWTLLTEEAMSEKKQFCSICLSAEVIDTTHLVEKYAAFSKKARIIELLIGHDPLMVYTNKELSQAIFGNAKTIDLERLCKVINDSIKYNFRLFSTSRESGTSLSYQHYFSKIKNAPQLDYLFDKGHCFRFYEDVSSDYLHSLYNVVPRNKKHFLILGSKYYKPTNEEVVGTYDSINIIDKKYALQKPIYIYFIARENNGEFTINNRIIDFLRKINVTQYIDKGHWNSICQGKIISHGELIISINDTTSKLYKEEQQRLSYLKSSFSNK